MYKNIALAAFLGGFISSAAGAAVMHVHDSSGTLATVDTVTGDVTVIGNMGHVMTDIAFDTSGNLYGVTFRDLYAIDVSTGASTLIGNHGIGSANALVFGSDNTLYAAAYNSSSLYSLDISTGANTDLGDMGFSSAGDLAFVGNDLYLAARGNSLVHVGLSDPTTSYSVGNMGVGGVYGIATTPDGDLLGVANTELYAIDTTTGSASFLLNFSGKGLSAAYGQSFYGESTPSEVPLPASAWLLAAGLGALATRKRRKAA